MISRREILAGLGTLAVAGIGPPVTSIPNSTSSFRSASSLPAKQDFAIPAGVTYLNCAYTHPMPLAAQRHCANGRNFALTRKQCRSPRSLHQTSKLSSRR